MSTSDYYPTSRNRGLEPDYARIDVGFDTVKNKCSRLWNSTPDELKDKGIQKNFKKCVTRYYLSKYPN